MHRAPTLRRAARSDIPAIIELAGKVWRAHYPDIIGQEQIEYMLERGYALDALAKFVDGQQSGIDLALKDDALIGFCAWMLVEGGRDCKVDKLYVDVEHQRGGVGGTLLGAAVSHARELGAQSLVLNVNKNNHRAIAAYRKHGFTVRESVVIDIGGGFVMDDYVMQRTV